MLNCTPQQHADYVMKKAKARRKRAENRKKKAENRKKRAENLKEKEKEFYRAMEIKEKTQRFVMIADMEGYSFGPGTNFNNDFEIMWKAVEEHDWIDLSTRFSLYFWWWNYTQLPLNDGWNYVYENRNYYDGYPPKIIGYRHDGWSDNIYYEVNKHDKLINKYVIAWSSITKEMWRKIWIEEVCVV